MKDGVHSGLDAFNRSFSEYIRWNKRELGVLIEQRARKLRYALFRAYKELAPKKGQVLSEAKSRGWRVKRPKGKTAMQEIRKRESGRMFAASSFIFRRWRYARSGRRLTTFAHTRGKSQVGMVRVNTAEGVKNPSVKITSFLNAAYELNRDRRVVDTAMAEQARDMAPYIAKKKAQARARIFQNVYKAVA